MAVFAASNVVYNKQYCWLTIYAVKESLVHHLDPQQYQPTRVVKANGVLPPILTHRQEELLIYVLDHGIYHLSVQQSIMYS